MSAQAINDAQHNALLNGKLRILYSLYSLSFSLLISVSLLSLSLSFLLSLSPLSLLLLGIKNSHYMSGRAEDVIPSHMLESYDINDAVAVVDPPRSGLRKNSSCSRFHSLFLYLSLLLNIHYALCFFVSVFRLQGDSGYKTK